MKIAPRTISCIALLLLLVGILTGCAPGPSGPPPSWEEAQKLEATKPDKALAAYAHIQSAHKGKNPEMAAEALLRSARYAADPNRYGTQAQIEADGIQRSPANLKIEMDTMREQGEQKAHQAYKEILTQYANTKSAQEVREKKELEAVEKLLDARYSPKLQYKIVDALISMTGRNPHFSYWFALIILACGVKLITFPLMLRTYKSQRKMQELQPKIKEIQEKYKDRLEQNQKMLDLWKQEGVNPFASCIPMLVQLPFIFWVYNAIRFYEFHFQNGTFLWINSTLGSQFPNTIASNLGRFDMPLLIVYAISNYMMMRLTPSPDPQQAQQQKLMSVWFTGIMFYTFIVYKWSSAFILYWLAQNVISAYQQYVYIYKPSKARAAEANVEILPAPERAGNNGTQKSTQVSNPGVLAPGVHSGMRPHPKRKGGKR